MVVKLQLPNKITYNIIVEFSKFKTTLNLACIAGRFEF